MVEPSHFQIEPPDHIDVLNDVLPQTQCTRCGYPDCRHYAQAIAQGNAPINQCPPGGAEGIDRLHVVSGQAAAPLNPNNGTEGPRLLAIIDEDWCIGCTLCIKACPVDSIVGAPKHMHTVIEDLCTGCELCLPACPVDCITLENISGQRTGWQAWTNEQALQAKQRYAFHQFRVEREHHENSQRMAAKAAHKLENLDLLTHHTQPNDAQRKRAVIEAAMAKARERHNAPPKT